MAKRIKFLSKKLLYKFLKICGLSSLFSFTGCVVFQDWFVKPFVCMYGVPENYVSGQVLGDMDGDGNVEPIPGIQYKFSSYGDNISYTSEDGFYVAQVPLDTKSISIEFFDIDGKENGSFKTKTVNIDFKNSSVVDKNNIILESDN